jgi:hypothetical protein
MFDSSTKKQDIRLIAGRIFEAQSSLGLRMQAS